MTSSTDMNLFSILHNELRTVAAAAAISLVAVATPVFSPSAYAHEVCKAPGCSAEQAYPDMPEIAAAYANPAEESCLTC